MTMEDTRTRVEHGSAVGSYPLDPLTGAEIEAAATS